MEYKFAVTRGDYSDYRVMCVCDSEQRAEEVAKLYNTSEDRWSTARVEEMSYIDHTPEEIVIHGLQCEIYDDGTTTDQRESIRREWEFDLLYPQYNVPVIWRWVRAPMHRNLGGRLEVHGADLERVRHVFSDVRAQLLADITMSGRKEINSR